MNYLIRATSSIFGKRVVAIGTTATSSLIVWILYKRLQKQKNPDKQVKDAIKLINAAKKSGVKKIKFKISNVAGTKLGSDSNLFPLHMTIVDNLITEIEVEFK